METAVSLQIEQYFGCRFKSAKPHCLPTLLPKDVSFPLQWNATTPRRTAGTRLHPWGRGGSTWAARCTKTWYMRWEAEMIRQSSVALRDTTLEPTSGLLSWPWHPAGAEWVCLDLLAYPTRNHVVRAQGGVSSCGVFLLLSLYLHLSSVRAEVCKKSKLFSKAREWSSGCVTC